MQVHFLPSHPSGNGRLGVKNAEREAAERFPALLQGASLDSPNLYVNVSEGGKPFLKLLRSGHFFLELVKYALRSQSFGCWEVNLARCANVSSRLQDAVPSSRLLLSRTVPFSSPSLLIMSSYWSTPEKHHPLRCGVPQDSYWGDLERGEMRETPPPMKNCS